MSKAVPDSNNQSLNHFLSDSVWQWQSIMDALSRRYFKLFLSLNEPIALLIDESGMPKKGKHSVGVAHLYCGQTGKQDNCQVGIFGELCSGNLVSIIQSRLHLPKEWLGNKTKGANVCVPLHFNKYKRNLNWQRKYYFMYGKILF